MEIAASNHLVYIAESEFMPLAGERNLLFFLNKQSELLIY